MSIMLGDKDLEDKSQSKFKIVNECVKCKSVIDNDKEAFFCDGCWEKLWTDLMEDVGIL